jgi:hypothetical protein
MSRVRELLRRGCFLLSYSLTSLRSTIVLSAGMPRSGSTWLFNATRLLLRQRCRGDCDLSCGWIGDWTNLPRRAWMLLKVHDYDPTLARHARLILYSYRDVRDALASARRKFGTEPTLDLAQHWLAADRRWRKKAAFTLRYESMLADPARTLRELARTLHLPLRDPEALLGRLTALEFRHDRATDGGHDGETLLHPGHTTDGRHGTWLSWLNPDLLRQLEEEFSSWLRGNGYPILSSDVAPQL